jgi:hypothetical protein
MFSGARATTCRRLNVKEQRQLNTLQREFLFGTRTCCKEDNGQASRLISTSKLRTSPSLHTWPITW